jgi:hypothetical protein
MKSKMMQKTFLLGFAVASSVCLLPSLVGARATGVCSDCHTMHNSQNGTTMFGLTAHGALTNGGCVGCHTGDNDGNNNIPYVMQTSEPTYNSADAGTLGDTLAGGNFYWVAQGGGDATGHNVASISAVDIPIGETPPGWNAEFTGNGLINNGGAIWTNQLTCAGTNGCHGDHTATNDWDAVAGAHHGDDGTINGESVAGSFRFLKGIKGLEDSDWEYQPTSIAHNQYYGIDKASDLHAGADSATISYLCAECHGNFHSGTDNLGAVAEDAVVESPWIRHPTDYDMGNVATKLDYAGYGGESHTYSVIAPVASDLANGVLNQVYQNADDAIVTCLSCHRAHGTPFDDLLRWDYDTCVSAGGDDACGCFECHTTKD